MAENQHEEVKKQSLESVRTYIRFALAFGATAEEIDEVVDSAVEEAQNDS